MINKICLYLLMVCLPFAGFCQVGIGTQQPSSQAVLELKDTSRGLLIPRIDSVHRKNIPSTKGLLVYDTTYSSFWFNNGTAWSNMPPKGNTAGELLWWNGNEWKSLPAGTSGQSLVISAGGVPVWAGGTSPQITTTALGSITQTTATSGGNVVTDGGSPITSRGVVWSTSPDPTVALSTKTINGSGTGSFTSNISGLTGGTTYYVRAYATNANGTTYGNQLNFVTQPASYTIGQNFGGGIIFYIDGTGQHGLIVSPTDLSTGIAWINSGTGPVTTNALGLAIGTGSANTNAIINIQGNTSYAASLCKLYYNGGGYTDWYLPSLYELNQLYLQRNAVGGIGGGFSGSYYWCSSEINTDNAWVIDFDNPGPNQSSLYKSNSMRVRAVRAF